MKRLRRACCRASSGASMQPKWLCAAHGDSAGLMNTICNSAAGGFRGRAAKDFGCVCTATRLSLLRLSVVRTFRSALNASPEGSHYAHVKSAASLVGHRVEQDVDPNRVRIRREPEEVVGLLAFTFPGIGQVGVVHHDDHEPAVVVRDAADIGWRAVFVPALDGASPRS